MKTSAPPRIALLVESSHAFGRKLLQGIAAYVKANEPWTLHFEERAFDDAMPDRLKQWQPDGVIARIATPQLARQLQRLHVPVVDLYEQNLLRGSSKVVDDHRAIMRLAIEHLRECGFQHFGYAGFPDAAFSRERAQWFSYYVTAWNFTPHSYTPPSTGKPRALAAIEAAARRCAAPLAEWLRTLPKPVGIVACNDMRAQQVLAVCNELGIEVPDAVGVIGVDNDEVRCDLSNPSLSSVDPNAYRIGFEAAGLLHRMIQGRRRAAQTVTIEPAGIVPRRSTDIQAFADPELSEAVRFMREHAGARLKLSTVLRHVGVSRATLYRLFLKNLGRTPRAEITRIQVQRARELLATTDLPLKQVARRAGFLHVETMYRVLKKATGQTPAQYRRATNGKRQ